MPLRLSTPGKAGTGASAAESKKPESSSESSSKPKY